MAQIPDIDTHEIERLKAQTATVSSPTKTSPKPRRTPPNDSTFIPALSLFVLLVASYTLTNPARFRVVDEVSIFAVTESIAIRGEVDTNTIAWTQWVNSPSEVLGAFGADGQVYSKKGPAPAFLAVPWYLLVLAISRLGSLLNLPSMLLQGTLLWNGFVTAITAILLWHTARRLGYCDRVGILVALLFGLSTIAWPYATHFFGEALSAFGMLLCFYGILTFWRSRESDGNGCTSRRRRFKIVPGYASNLHWMFLAGIGGAIVLMTVTAHLFAIGLLLLYGFIVIIQATKGENFLKRCLDVLASFAPLVAPILLAVALLLYYNQIRFDSPFETGYHFNAGEGFTTPMREGLWGLVLSPYRGLFWHTPLFLASLIGTVPFWRRNRLEAGLIIAVSITFLGVYSMWWMWWGGFAWGPRFLVPLSPLWTLLLAPLLTKATQMSLLRWGLIILALTSGIIQFSATTVNYVNYEIALRSIYPTDWADPLAHGPPAQQLSEYWRSPIFGQWKLVFENFHPNFEPAWIWQKNLSTQGREPHFVTAIAWSSLLTGLTTLCLSGWALFWWWRRALRWRRGLLFGLPILLTIFLLLWMRGADSNLRLGRSDPGLHALLSDLCKDTDAVDASSPLVYVAPTSYSSVINWIPALCTRVPAPYGYAESSMKEAETKLVMSSLLKEETQLWFVTGRLQAHSPTNTVERWLAENAYLAQADWYGDYRLLRYATGKGLSADDFQPLNQTLSKSFATNATKEEPIKAVAVKLVSADLLREIGAGQPLPLQLTFVIETQGVPALRWFVQLLNNEGVPVALLDTAPLDGYIDFTALPVKQTLVERAALWIEPETPHGVYQLIAGLYDSTDDNKRLTTEVGSDFVELGTVEIGAPK